MTIDQILELTWVPVIVFGICLGYGILLLITKNPKALLSKKNPQPVKNAEKYAVEGGKLLIFMGIGSLVNCFLLFVNAFVAIGQIIAWFMVFAVLWKKIYDQYGPR